MSSVRRALPLGVLVALMGISPVAAEAKGQTPPPQVHAAQADTDDEAPVLPSRLAIAIKRTENALDKAEGHIDDGEYKQSLVSLRSVQRNMYRADRAANRAINAPPPTDPDAEETTTGPDSLVAILSLDHEVVVRTAGLFDTNSKGVVDSLSRTMFRTLNARDKVLAPILAADPEAEDAPDYSDVMADSLADYPDEVANLQEALEDDTLSAGGEKVLTKALAQSQATANAVTLAFGGGE